MSGPDCIPVMVLQNSKPKLSHVLAELFNMCLKESCFLDCWKVSSVVSVFRNVEEMRNVRNVAYFHISSMASRFFSPMQMF